MKKGAIWFIGLIVVFISLMMPYSPALSADFRITDSTGLVKVDSTVQTRNLFVMGNDITVEAKEIQNDLFAFGMNVQLNTQVQQGSFVAGKNVTMQGSYLGNLFVAGDNITLHGEIMGEIFLIGNQWRIAEDAIIHGDVHVLGGLGYIDGIINGSLLGSGNEWYINGQVERPVRISVGKSLTIGEKADIAEITYQANQEATVMKGAVVEKIIYNPLEQKEQAKKALFRFPVIPYLASLLFALMLVFLFKKLTRQALSTMHQQFFASLGIGFTILVATPVLSLIILVTLAGYQIAFAMLLLYGLLLLSMYPLAGIWLGELCLKLFKHQVDSPSWLGALIGVTLMQFVLWIPLVGWIILLLLNVIALGGIVIALFQQAKSSEAG